MKVNRFKVKDKASSYNRSLLDKIYTFIFRLLHPQIKIGYNSIIKPGNEFKLTDGAIIQIGNYCTVKENSYFLLTKPKPFLEIGDYSGIGRSCYIAIKDHLKIGKYTRIGPDVCILDQDHSFDRSDLIMNQHARIKKVTIGSDVWIGRGATILRGVTIGDGAVIGAGAIVTKNIPSYEIWAGVPAKFMKNRE
jgi:acetyltransferase-like isoleucine patch superfamily enzyme